MVVLVLFAMFVAGVRMYLFGQHRRISTNSGAVNKTPYTHYAALGGYSLPPEGFSIDSVSRSQMPQHAAEQTERLKFFLDLVGD